MKRDQIAQLLPAVFRSTIAAHTPLAALLEVMEALHLPAERLLAEIDAIFDPYRSPEAFVPVLASWLDLERFFTPRRYGDGVWDETTEPLSSGIGRVRELVVAATMLSQWRGTATGLVRFLEIATGVAGFVIDEKVDSEDGTMLPFHLQVNAPAASLRHQALIERILDQEKPAYVTYRLVFAQ